MEHVEQLKAYVLQQLQNGLTPDEIAAQLRQVGWSEDVLQQAFTAILPSTSPAVAGHEPVGDSVAQTPTAIFTASAQKRGRIKTAWLLFKQSVQVLRVNKSLVRYPAMIVIFSVITFIIFAIIFFFGSNVLLKNTTAYDGQRAGLKPLGYLVGFGFYVVLYFVNNFYSAGLAANVLDLFEGKKQPYGNYIARARSRAGTIFVFAVIEATVGMILKAIAERSRVLGWIVSRILGAIWTLATLFVDPIIISTNDTAPQAIKRSVRLFKSTWGENIVGRVSLGVIAIIIYVILLIVGFTLIIISGTIGGGVLAAIMFVIMIVALFVVGLAISAASSILNTVLYYYAEHKQVPAAFDADLLNALFIPRKKRFGIFRKAS